MEIKKTHNGFDIIEFDDMYNTRCSLQESSLATEEAIWLGVSDPRPVMLASQTSEGGTGWVDYPVPDNVHISGRMHLTREQVKKLLPHLKRFVKNGEL